MFGGQLRARLDRIGLPLDKAAAVLGLSLRGLYHQMAGERRVSRQTELLLIHLERAAHGGKLDELPTVEAEPAHPYREGRK